LWEGRFKFFLVHDEVYLLLYLYIELNPVRADMVADPAKYKVNTLGKTSILSTPQPLNIVFGMNIVEYQVCYRPLFTTHIKGTLLDDIRDASQSGMVLGNDRFKA
jgi:putative transposase